MKPFNYDKQWKSVDELLQKGLNQSAEKEIKLILNNARKEKNTEEYIRAICSYRVSMRDRQEDSRLLDIQFFHEEIKTATFPGRQILFSMLAELYWSYYTEHRYKILELTPLATSHPNKKIPDAQADITTWTANQFYQATYACYQASLEEKVLSQQLKLGKLQRILDPGQNTAHLRPTLYDFLVFRAIEFYKMEESELTMPDYQFELDDAVAFAPWDQFINHTFKTEDSLSKKFIALLLFQDLLRFHALDKDPAARIDADILRIRFVQTFSVHSEKNKLYTDALKQIYQTHPHVAEAAMARFYYAETLAQGGTYVGNKAYLHAANQEDKVNYVEARMLATEIIKSFPNSEASYQAQILMNQIEAQTLQLQMEHVILPEKPSLISVNFRNVSRFYYKVVALSHEDFKKYRQYYYEKSAELLARKAFRYSSVDLPATKDYKNHSTEIKLDGLPFGSYLIISSLDSEFSKKSLTSFSFIQVTNMTFLATPQVDKQAQGIWVIHRETGKPMAGVTVKFWKSEYNYKTNKNEEIEFQSRKSDQQGFVALGDILNNTNLLPELIQGQDCYFTGEGVFLAKETETERSFDRTFMFTDRSIYRPGQTIYFKGIMVHSSGIRHLEHEVIPSRKTTVSLIDVNGQVVETKEFQTNSYGAFSGQFSAPMGLLTGSFRLQAEGGQAMIQIEEYKRPAFEVVLDTFKDSYRLNEKIKVKGQAKAYAGNALDGATVKYRVTRNARFPYYWCYYAWGLPSSPAREITHGTIKTQADGSFEFVFQAEPDVSVDKRSMPVFDFTIHVDVTDVQTETRSSEVQLPVAYQSLQLKLATDKIRSVNSFNAVEVFSTNTVGTHVPTEVTLSLKKLEAPNRFYRERRWQKPEIYSISEEDFRRDFPLDSYGEENNPLQWKEQKTVWSHKITTTSNGVVYLQKTGSGDGWYLLEVKAKDAFGEDVQEKQIIRLYSGDSPKALPNEALLLDVNSEKNEPGDISTCRFSSSFNNVHLFYLLDRISGSSINHEAVQGYKFWNYTLNENDRGGFYINAMFVKDNRVYRAEQTVQVPYSNKELQLSVETFRDKMIPGSEQEWKLRIRGSKKELVSAEVLATMYDASLDAFMKHSWSGMQLFGSNRRYHHLGNPIGFNTEQSLMMFSPEYKQITPYLKNYPQLKWWDLNQSAFSFQRFAFAAMADEAPMALSKSVKAPKGGTMEGLEMKDTVDDVSEDEKNSSSKAYNEPTQNQGLRTNLQETAFFMPHLQTNTEGDVILSFKAPEALTKWKMMAFAHTTTLAEGQVSETSQTQKDIMIMPNTPRFLRESDQMDYVAKLVNLSTKTIDLEAELEVLDAKGIRNLNSLFQIKENKIRRTLKPGESAPVSWKILVPADYYEPVLVRTSVRNVDANSNFISDGEQHLLPVLVNSMLVTETLPLPVRPNTTKSFKLLSLLNSKQSSTLRHYNLSIEYTTNPAWYAIQSLPYLTDYPYECAEQTFNRYYANALATHIANSNPKLNEIFSKWKAVDSSALLSNLQKNQELKNALLEETPWVLQARSEEEQKRNVAILFDLQRMARELERTTRELSQMQTPNGGFTWFKGMPEDRFITQYILTGLGRLMHLGVQEIGNERRVMQLVERALPYLDTKLQEDYNNLVRSKVNMNDAQIGYTQIQYLYMRSFFADRVISPENQKAFQFYKQQAAKFWVQQNKYMQALSALALSRFKVEKIPLEIMTSLRENAIIHEETGMYWKELQQSMWWYEAPIEAQSVMIEAFKEVAQSETEVDALKIWLLKNKQTTHWKTTKATADACYALLLNGSYWLAAQPSVKIQLGDTQINSSEEQQEAGSGYFKKSFSSDRIHSEMGNIQVQVQSSREVGTTWGAVYWQYFEQLDRIKSSDDKMPLRIVKKLFKVKSTASGEVLLAVNDQDELQSGDKVIVRIELKVDRPMEYVHLKDMRGACFEPLNVLSMYKYQSGLGYYESTRDLATNFFFHYLNRGNYVFEYPMFVSTKGNYSNGIAQIQCMYAPEFSSHSEGIRVQVR